MQSALSQMGEVKIEHESQGDGTYLPYLIQSGFLTEDINSTTSPSSIMLQPYHSPDHTPPHSTQPTSSRAGRKSLSIDTSVARRTQIPNGPNTTTASFMTNGLLSPSSRVVSPISAPIRRRRGEHLNAVNPDVGPFFRPTTQYHEIYSMDKSRRYTLRILPKIDRGFFMAENDWTCYRRNYFQLSAAFTAQDAMGEEIEMPALVKLGGAFKKVETFAICVSARVANGEKKIDLVQQTAKRDKGPQILPEPRPLKSGGNPYEYCSTNHAQSVITFERMQFKTATANNGKRKAAQQYYVLLMDLYMFLEDGTKMKIATTESASLVVRGRSPGHYLDVQQERALAAQAEEMMRRANGSSGPLSAHELSPVSPYSFHPYNSFITTTSKMSYSPAVVSPQGEKTFFPPTLAPSTSSLSNTSLPSSSSSSNGPNTNTSVPVSNSTTPPLVTSMMGSNSSILPPSLDWESCPSPTHLLTNSMQLPPSDPTPSGTLLAPVSSEMECDLVTADSSHSLSDASSSYLFNSSFDLDGLMLTPVTPPGSTPSTPAMDFFGANKIFSTWASKCI